MSVKAPAEKNFRRARTRARPARRRKLRALFSWRVARGLLIVTLIALAKDRLARSQTTLLQFAEDLGDILAREAGENRYAAYGIGEWFHGLAQRMTLSAFLSTAGGIFMSMKFAVR